ncbi:SNF2-related domain-containing protein [Cavenderia fasciculata]|uniref:SNF2-related domain-containing protein n=1 Tax=Cavenderia fasciculata TaxID=261658 RepID=F4PMS8_CACFS|nr:SNF2-related domain-containing protein [Cavenderia fasciculata]EGG23672.1 SNF2-related domain-containing protein [Cavenderia fasciculata]|eukprot:XP_004361523.1 SNF2-related domain-containing protein [Cavenderia fasciculata]
MINHTKDDEKETVTNTAYNITSTTSTTTSLSAPFITTSAIKRERNGGSKIKIETNDEQRGDDDDDDQDREQQQYSEDDIKKTNLLERWHQKLMKLAETQPFIDQTFYFSKELFNRHSLSSYSLFKQELIYILTTRDQIKLENDGDENRLFRVSSLTLLQLLDRIKDYYYVNNFELYKEDFHLVFAFDAETNPYLDKRIGGYINQLISSINDQLLLELFDLQQVFKKKKASTVRLESSIVATDRNIQKLRQAPKPSKKPPSKKKLEKENKAKKIQIKQDNKKLLFQQLEKKDQDKFNFKHVMENLEKPLEWRDSPLPFPYQHINLVQPDGMFERMKLYNYQQNGLAKMIRREASLGEPYINPIWIKLPIDQENNEEEEEEEEMEIEDTATTAAIEFVYKNLITKKTVKKEPKDYYLADIKGGILCEEMGTGKTVISIALILSTLGSFAKVPDNPPPNWEIILPPMSLETKDKKKQIIDLDYEQMEENNNDNIDSSVPTLMYYGAREVILKGYPYRTLFHQDIVTLVQQIPKTRVNIYSAKTFQRSCNVAPIRTLVLSSTTLIIVPHHILHQWNQETMMHRIIKKLVIDSEDHIPSIEELVGYDLVIMSHNKVSRLDTNDNSIDSQAQSLLGIYWLRVIIDEGHVIGNSSTKMTNLVKDLAAERRWVCSGTPVSSSLVSNELSNLYSILSFLRVNPYKDADTFRKLISTPTTKLDPRGIDRLVQVLSRISIRTPSAVVARDLQLPTLTVDTHMVSLSKDEIIKYNEIVFQVATNLLASQYEGPDSLFSAGNQKYAIEVFNQLRRACFYSPGLEENQRQMAREAIESAIQRNDYIIPLADKLQLLKIYKYFEAISKLQNPQFTELSFFFKEKEKEENVDNNQEQKEKKKVRFIIPDVDNLENNSVENLNNNNNNNNVVKLEKNAEILDNNITDNNNNQKKNTAPIGMDSSILNNTTTIAQPKLIDSSKLDYLIKRLQELEKKGIKLMAMKHAKLNFLQYHSNMKLKKRAMAILSFQTDSQQHFIVMNTDLAAYGINLTAANHIIFVDQLTSEGKERQAIKRAHRIGQLNPVSVEKLIIPNTIEQMILSTLNHNQNQNNQNNQNNNNQIINLEEEDEQMEFINQEIVQQEEEGSSLISSKNSSEFLFQDEKREEQSTKIKNILRSLVPLDLILFNLNYF